MWGRESVRRAPAATRVAPVPSTVIVIRGMRAIGKNEIFSVCCIVIAALSTVSAFVPSSQVAYHLVVSSFIEAISIALSNAVPTAMLADVVEYDVLHSGLRREGQMTMIDTTVGQLLRLATSVVPPLALTHLGFRINAGCSCGCGVPCGAEYLRWECGADIGYACSADASSAPFFGDAHRQVPCTLQPAAALRVIDLFFFWLPAAFAILAATSSLFAPIDAEMTRSIVEQSELRDKGLPCIDPVTGEGLARKLDESDEDDVVTRLGCNSPGPACALVSH